MNIVKEKTRLLFTDYTEPEKQFLENAVASMDNIFMYVDPDKDVLGLPTGMETSVKKMFPNAKFVDNSSSYWPFARIDPVSNDAQPRNQLQIDFINFLLENSNKQQKAAGILSTGTGKMNPLSEPIYTPSGWKQMGLNERRRSNCTWRIPTGCKEHVRSHSGRWPEFPLWARTPMDREDETTSVCKNGTHYNDHGEPYANISSYTMLHTSVQKWD